MDEFVDKHRGLVMNIKAKPLLLSCALFVGLGTALTPKPAEAVLAME